MIQTAFVLISCMIGQEHYVLEQIKSIPQVKSSLITYGEYDIVVKIESESAKENGRNNLITNKADSKNSKYYNLARNLVRM